MTVWVRAPGKVNLFLAVGRAAPDGYHPLATVFQAVSVYDTITASPAVGFSVTMGGLGSGLPVDASNLAVRAALALAEYAGVEARAEIRIDKQIPVAGGMAGGSADAAGTLVALNELWGLGLRALQLRGIGAGLGADVPFCLMGGTALGRGRGDQLMPLLSRGIYEWVLVMQKEGLSTPKVFAEFDAIRPDAPEVPEVDDHFLAAVTQGETELVARSARNDLAVAALRLHDEAQAVMEVCRLAGLAAFVSGSGPTIAVHVPAEKSPDEVARLLLDALPGVRCVHASGPVAGAQLL